MKTAVIIPVFNNLNFTKRLVDDMLKFTPPDLLVVVDNGSTDGTPSYVETLCKQHPSQVQSIRLARNYGFSYACNTGTARAIVQGGECLILLNNDVRILDLGWLEDIKRAIAANRRRLVGAHIISGNTLTQLETGECLPYMAGWCLAFHRLLVDELGEPFDPRFFAYYEDVDLSYRALKRGFLLHEIQELGLFHYGGRTGALLDDFSAVCAESRRLFKAKWGISLAHHPADDYVGVPA